MELCFKIYKNMLKTILILNFQFILKNILLFFVNPLNHLTNRGNYIFFPVLRLKNHKQNGFSNIVTFYSNNTESPKTVLFIKSLQAS